MEWSGIVIKLKSVKGNKNKSQKLTVFFSRPTYSKKLITNLKFYSIHPDSILQDILP